MLLGFFLNILTYGILSVPEVRLTFSRLPRKWNQVINYQRKYSGFIPNATISEWDSPTLLNLTFKWLSNNESLCKMQLTDDHYLMPVLIHTARFHFEERLAIRNSWGSSDKLHIIALKKWRVQPVFLLGEADPSILQQQEQNWKLMEEHEKYGDLIIGNFIDSYRNLTYKHLMGYKWILNFCQNAQFVLKLDDDIFIDIFKWIRWRLQDLERNNNDDNHNLPCLYCFTHVGAMPRRKISDKWFISQDIYSEDYYPEYCMGGSYGMTVDHIKRIYYISNFAKFIWIDDLFVTGILPEVGEMWFKYENIVRHLYWKNVQIDKSYLKEGLCQGGNAQEMAVVFLKRGMLFERDMMCLWNKSAQIE